MVRINEWNCTKTLVIKTTNDETQLLDINLLSTLLKQVQYLKNIHYTQNKYGFVDQKHSCKQIHDQILCELSKARPTEIENQLKDYSVGLSEADCQVGEI